jgi:hypothetical protein
MAEVDVWMTVLRNAHAAGDAAAAQRAAQRVRELRGAPSGVALRTGPDPFAGDDLLSDEAIARKAAGESITPSPAPAGYLSKVQKAARKAGAADGSMALGALESLGALVSGAVATPVASAAGIGTEAARGLGLTNARGEDVAERVQSAMTYEPRGASGRAQLGLVGAVSSPLAASGADMALMPLAGGVPALTRPRGAPRRPVKRTADDVLGELSQARSAGASGATPNIANASPELRQAIERTANAGGNINQTVLQRHLDAESLPVPIRLSEGQATGDARLISREMNQRGRSEQLSTHFSAQNRALGENLRAVRESVGPNAFSSNMVEHGDTLIGAYRAKDAAAQADIGAKYEALRQAAGGDIPIDAASVWTNAEARLKKRLLFEHAPKGIMRQLARMRDEGMNFEQFEAMRTNLAEIQRSHTASGLERRAAGEIRQALEDLPLHESAAGLKSLADDARAAARAQFQALEADPAYLAAVEGSVTPDQFAKKFVVNGSRDHVGIMRKNLESDEAALQTMGVAVLDHLRDQARLGSGYEGNFAAASFEKAVRQLDPKLRHILTPEAADTLERLANVSKLVVDQPRGSFVNNSNTFVAAAGDLAAETAAGVTNVALGGIPLGTWLQRGAKGIRERREVGRALAPGAGLDYVDATAPPAARSAGERMAQQAVQPEPPQPMEGELMPRAPLALPAPNIIAGSRSAPGTAYARQEMGMTPDVEQAGALHPGAARETIPTGREPALGRPMSPDYPAALPHRPTPAALTDQRPMVVDAQGRIAPNSEKLRAYLQATGQDRMQNVRQPRAEPVSRPLGLVQAPQSPAVTSPGKRRTRAQILKDLERVDEKAKRLPKDEPPDSPRVQALAADWARFHAELARVGSGASIPKASE